MEDLNSEIDRIHTEKYAEPISTLAKVLAAQGNTLNEIQAQTDELLVPRLQRVERMVNH